MVKTIALNFDGYYEEEDLPIQSHNRAGVYVVYAGMPAEKGYCDLRELLYIGRSGDMTDRLDSSHHKYNDWHKHLYCGEILYFSFADTDDEERAEAALIYRTQPICNDTGKNGFHHPKTTINTSGQSFGLEGFFTVWNTG
jgi:hypothetical protein